MNWMRKRLLSAYKDTLMCCSSDAAQSFTVWKEVGAMWPRGVMLSLGIHFMSTEKRGDLIAVQCSSLKYKIIISPSKNKFLNVEPGHTKTLMSASSFLPAMNCISATD